MRIGRGIPALESQAHAADRRDVIARLRGQSGFGLIELLMAMVMLNIGLLAVVAAFTSGMWGLARAGSISTAAALGDAQMELYRGLPNACIYITSPPSSGTYAGDSAYSSTQVTSATACTALSITPPTKATTPSQTGVIGPDHHKYEVDTYIVSVTPQSTARAIPQVTVVVRDGLTPSKVLARQSSTFDASSG
jgi:Tfp pilus assembly protein PilV